MPFGVYKGVALVLRAERREDDIEIWLRLTPLFLSTRRRLYEEHEYLDTLQQKNLRIEIFDGVRPYPVPHTTFMQLINRFKRWLSLKRSVRRLARAQRWNRLQREIIEAALAPRNIEKQIDWWLECSV